MAIPTVPGSDFVQTPQAAVKLSAEALNAPQRAQAQLGQAMMNVGSVLGDISLQMQKAKNFSIAADADATMRKTANEFRLSLKGRTDEENWGKEWADVAQQTQAAILDKHNVGPQLKRQLDANFKEWSITNEVEVKTLAKNQMLNRAQDRVSLAAEEAAKDGDEHGIQSIIHGAVANKIIFPEAADKMLMHYGKRMDEYAAKRAIELNSKDAWEQLQAEGEDKKPTFFSRLDQDQRDSLLREARTRTHQAQSDNLADIRSTFDLTGTVPSEDEIKAHEASGAISPRGAASLRAYIKQTKFNEAKAEAADIINDVVDYDPTAKDASEQYRDIMDRATALPGPYRDRIKRKLDAKQKSGATGDDGERVIKDLYQMNLFGRIKKEYTWDDPVTPKEKTEALNRMWVIQQELEDYRKKSPKPPSRQEEREFVMKAAQQHVDSSATTAVLNALTGSSK